MMFKYMWTEFRSTLKMLPPAQTAVQWSAGLGVSASLNNTLDLKVTVGWPLIDSANSQRGEPRANLSVGGQF